jgi:hypothetical protein
MYAKAVSTMVARHNVRVKGRKGLQIADHNPRPFPYPLVFFVSSQGCLLSGSNRNFLIAPIAETRTFSYRAHMVNALPVDIGSTRIYLIQ